MKNPEERGRVRRERTQNIHQTKQIEGSFQTRGLRIKAVVVPFKLMEGKRGGQGREEVREGERRREERGEKQLKG